MSSHGDPQPACCHRGRVGEHTRGAKESERRETGSSILSRRMMAIEILAVERRRKRRRRKDKRDNIREQPTIPVARFSLLSAHPGPTPDQHPHDRRADPRLLLHVRCCPWRTLSLSPLAMKMLSPSSLSPLAMKMLSPSSLSPQAMKIAVSFFTVASSYDLSPQAFSFLFLSFSPLFLARKSPTALLRIDTVSF